MDTPRRGGGGRPGRGRGRGVRRGRGLRVSTDAPAVSFSLEDEMKRVKAGWAQDKKNMNHLSSDQKKALLELREQKQVARFLLPDAPTQKTRKRKPSPLRISCPLATGTPVTPPPNQPRPWAGSRDQPGTSRDHPGTSQLTYQDVIDISNRPTPTIGEASAASLASKTGITDPDVIDITRRPTPTIAEASSAFLASETGIPDQDVIDITRMLTPSTVEASEAFIASATGTKDQDVTNIMRRPTLTIGETSVLSLASKTETTNQEVIEGSPVASTVLPKGLFSSKKRRKLTFSPSTGILTATSNVLDYPLVEADIEILGFSPSTPSRQPPSCPGSGSSTSSSVGPRTYAMLLEDELADLDLNAGSDIEEDPEEFPLVDTRITLRERSVNEFPTTAFSEMVDPAILDHLEAMDAEDDAALRDCVTQDMLWFEWSSDPDIFKGEKETFIGNAGPTFSVEGLSPLQIFEKIWDTNIMSTIVRETNRYAHQLQESSDVKRQSRIKRWQDVDERDMWTFFAIMMLQSFVPNPVESEYWYPKYSYLKIGDFPGIMSFKKFLLIKKCLHFVDNQTIISTAEKKLAKIQPVLDHLNEKFSTLYTPEQTIAIDESLLMWKGNLSFAQLISNKHAKVGIKSYELCESRTGYLWKMQVYSGKSEHQQELSEGSNAHSNEPQNATSQIVLNLMRPLLHKGHVLVMDNFYNSPLLSRALKLQYQTDTIGTLRLNRMFVPDSLKSKTKTNMRTGEVCCSQTSDLSVVVWRDNNLVAMVSTYHKVEVAGREKYGYYKYKPKVVLDYNLSMGGVDKKDQLLHSYPVERVRNAVWYKKLFRRLLNVSIHNAYVLFSHHRKTLVRDFRMRLADEILKKYSPFNTDPTTPRSLTCVSVRQGHFPKKNEKIQRCKLCAQAKISRRTIWRCEACNINLCIEGCFKDHHTELLL